MTTGKAVGNSLMIIDNTFNSSTWAFFYAFVAVCTFFFVFMNFEKTHMLKNPGDKTGWTEKLAKWSEVEYACQYDNEYNNDYVCIELLAKKLKRVEQIICVHSERKDKYKKYCEE